MQVTFVGTHLGTPGQMADALFGGHDPTSQVMLSPAASWSKMTWDNISSGHLERPIYDAMAVNDPTGIASLLRPTFYNLTKEK